MFQYILFHFKPVQMSKTKSAYIALIYGTVIGKSVKFYVTVAVQ